MKVRRQIEIEEMTHEDIVDFLSTALCGNPSIGVEEIRYDGDTENDPDGDRCYEDRLADALLNGGTVVFYDNDSDGEVYGTRGQAIKGDDFDMTVYPTTLEDIKRGIENAFSGNFKCWDPDGSFYKEAKEYVMNCAVDLIDDPCMLDFDEANTLLQIILFNEVVYG